MIKKTNQTKNDVVADNTSATNVNVETTTSNNKELVMKATIGEKHSSTAVLINRSQNYVCLYGNPEQQITLAPREIKQVDKDLVKELLKNPMVRRFFDKGVVSHNIKDESTVTAHGAVTTPKQLTNPVSRFESGNNVVAEVKKFRQDGSLNLNLG